MDLARFREEFTSNFQTRGELGASVSVYRRGEPLVRLAGGYADRAKQVAWTRETRVLLWSATKGVAAGCLLHACSRHGVELDAPVSRLWPEYGCAGKQRTTIRHVLSHQAGQPALRGEPVPVLDHAAVVHALAKQLPFWAPGERHGYHVRTYGFLVDELVRRITGGLNVGRYLRDVFGDPLGLDLWIGLPESLSETVAPIQAPRTGREASAEEPFYAALNDPQSLTRLAFTNPAGLATPSSMNTASVRAHVLASFGGIGTAEALARFYQLLCHPNEFFPAEVLEAASRPVTSGKDEILRVPTAFSTGFMMDPVDERGKGRALFGPSTRAFGQPGAGGSHAFADPEHGISFAYVMNQMEPGLFPNRKSLQLVDAIYVSGTKR
ncbi:MAG: beta-lactamase family protein [Verrucomicrobia bacterium]|nr:beta-lactamase family protein [Verrucomicrobiota bacterium]